MSRHNAAIEGWVLADVGGTRTRLAILAAGGTLGPIRVTDNDRYPDLRAVIESGLKAFPKDRSRLGVALAVAAPVVGDAPARQRKRCLRRCAGASAMPRPSAWSRDLASSHSTNA